MKFRFGAYACMMFGLAAVMTACGGGGGGGAVGVTIPVTASKNPQLNSSLVTITADFTNYTSTKRFGAAAAKPGVSLAKFTVAPATTIPATALIQADNKASVDFTGQNNTYTVTASFNAASGSKAVTFIPQPKSAAVLVKAPALTALGYIQCTVTNDLPVIFSNLSSIKPAGSFISVNPAVGPGTIPGPVIPAIVAGSAFNVALNTTLFKLSYNMSGVGVPNFAINGDQALTYYVLFADPTTTLSPALTVQQIFYSELNGTGTTLYQSP